MATQILLCDDEVHILRAAEFKLKRAGYEVICAADGEEAWDKIQAHLPDMLVTDFQMPRLTGLELVARLRTQASTQTLPVVMLTGKGYEVSAGRLAEEFGVLAVLAKPFSPRELLRLVASVLGTPDDPLATTPVAGASFAVEP